MTKPPLLPTPTYVDTRPALELLVADLEGVDLVAVDTESNSLYAYHERVCLVQLSTRNRDYIVDPLALDDLSPLASLMADPNVEKIFHAAEYDIMGLKRDFGFKFAGLFDTMLAARILGYKEVGLGSLLKRFFGVSADKRHQRDNWGERPIPRDRLVYAQMDTHYLPALRDILAGELKMRGHWEEAQEAFAGLTDIEPVIHEFDPNGFWRLRGADELDPVGLSVLRELYIYREQKAELLDKPRFKILGDSVLVALAKARPHAVEELSDVPGMSRYLIRRYGKGVLKAVKRGERRKPPAKPPHGRGGRPDDEVLARYDALMAWRKRRAEERGVQSDVIMPKSVLWQLAMSAPQTMEELKEVEGLGPWKLRTYGRELLDVIRSI